MLNYELVTKFGISQHKHIAWTYVQDEREYNELEGLDW